jgi:hypothetical protein
MRRKDISIPLATGFSVLLAVVMVSAVEHPPDVNPANFKPSQRINNLFYPLPVGRLFVYEGTKEGIPNHDEVCVTTQTKLIEGVRTRVVHHRSFENGALVENTFDWFAQDVFGTVWYFGEDTTELPSGSTEGSWESGVADADAGFIMLANPQAGDQYYQEFARNVAEDQAKVLGRDESACLRSGQCYNNLLLTQETSRLDPGVVEHKYYAPTIGFILGVTVKGGDERTELVRTGTCSE